MIYLAHDSSTGILDFYDDGILKTSFDLNNDPNYLIYGLNPSNTISGAKFFGWTCGPSYSIESGSCYRTCTYHIFWLEATEPNVFTCGNLPGRY